MPFLSKKNRKKQEDAKASMSDADRQAMHDAMMSRCVLVAKEILKLIVSDDLGIGDTMIQRDAEGNAVPMREDSRPQDYQDTAKKIQQLFLDHDLLWLERHMVFMLVKQPMDMLQNIVLTDLEKTYQDGICRMFGIEVFGELTFRQIDEALKKYHPKLSDKAVEEAKK